jgi:hypothetical protein
MQAPTGLIPAMTTDAERECYYRLAKEAAGKGAIIELGAWLGASTAYIAAGLRDAGRGGKVQVYDKFRSKPGHLDKVKAFYRKRGVEERMPVGPCLDQFRANLGPLMTHVEPHPGLIENMEWTGGDIALLITDAPKRVPQISAVLTKLRDALGQGAVMAWQDFCHFPSYEIPACLYLLREHLEFVEAVVPGTTLVFRVRSRWSAEEVSPEALALSRWTPEKITQAWEYWLQFVPPEKAALFRCGAAMFLCDIGRPAEAVAGLVCEDGDVVTKWRYLKQARPDFRTRYAPLFDAIAAKL